MKNKSLEIIKLLRERGERITPARRKIVEIFFDAKKPLTAAELALNLKKARVKSDKTTVYRQIEDLVIHGILEEVRFEDRVKRYELSLGWHHHHLVCVSCGKVADVELAEDLGKQKNIIFKKYKFQVLRHSLEFFGQCRSCSKK
ncbi:MAG: transcriptional repressor [Patescibacteria group bacterium]|jgi:Fe2+ or Zn2+ uptake regulation protein